jgi:hypothetical protein
MAKAKKPTRAPGREKKPVRGTFKDVGDAFALTLSDGEVISRPMTTAQRNSKVQAQRFFDDLIEELGATDGMSGERIIVKVLSVEPLEYVTGIFHSEPEEDWWVEKSYPWREG